MSGESELLHGPVEAWEPSDDDKEVIARLLASDNELDRAYGEAYQEGCFVVEFAGVGGGFGMTAVGQMANIEIAQFRLGREVDIRRLTVGECINLGAYPGAGATREARVRDGVRQVVEMRNRDPDELDHYGSHIVNGFRFELFMPAGPRHALQWTIKVYRSGEDSPFRIDTIPMAREPLFGVDVADLEALRFRVGALSRELSAV